MTTMAERAQPWRCFWAIPLPDGLRESLSAFVAHLRAVPGVEDDWRFADPGSWHVTLAFLGGIEADAVAPMVAAVASALISHAPSEATAGGLGSFPGGSRARVLWLGVADAGGALSALAADVRSTVGLDDDQPFRPHVTLARSRDRHGCRLPLFDAAVPEGRIRVAEVVLFRSHLGRGPARYERLASIPLQAPVAAAVAQ